jgi:NitT/TauT family transport system substrate-binding protein
VERLIQRTVLSAACVIGLASNAQAEVNELNMSRQFGIAFIPQVLIEKNQLIEKNAAAAGLGAVKVNWGQYSGSAGMNDALLSGNVPFGTGSIPAMLILWAKTKGTPIEVMGLCATNSMPVYLNTRDPGIKSLRDFTSKDRIALPAVKLSTAAIVLQMAAAKEFGKKNFAQLDQYTVSMSHPDAVAALLSNRTEIKTHFASPPYQIPELKDPNVHTIVNSVDVMGDASLTAVWTTKKFADANPKLTKAVYDSFQQAIDMINKDKAGAVKAYLEMTKEKTDPEDLIKYLDDPHAKFMMAPEGTMRMAKFMYDVGTIKREPANWKDYFLPIAYGLSGS